MIKLFIGVLIVAEVAMMATHLPKSVKAPRLIAAPARVDAKWARAMDRKADQEARDAASTAGRRQALDACLGPDRETFSTRRYETRAKACEAQIDGRAAEAEQAPVFEYPKPMASPPGPSPSAAQAQEPNVAG